jgi:D-alanyl-D-alanine carboxypeptidase
LEEVGKKFYECTVISREHNVNLMQWFNSNKLLNDNFIGIKTGTTPTAGPCLCGYFAYKDFNAIACVMNTKTVDSRWKDMAMLFLWALDKYL